jgi:threonine dehydrogenase-like Zn-dependent dehydrogenase
MAAVMQRAAVLTEPLKTQVSTSPLTHPIGREVRVKLQGSGVCASNLAVWEGRPWFKYPLPAGAPGHEGWGVVDAVGADVQDLHPGERVALISGHAYAQYDIADRDSVVRLPTELAGLPFPGEPFGCGMNIFERSDIRAGAGQRVAIVGAGFLGLLLTQLAAGAGAQVVVLSRRRYALDMARKMGALEVVQTDCAGDARAHALALTNGRGYERVIETGGLQTTLDLASALTAEYGRLVIAGYHQDGARQVDMQQWNWRALDVINAHERSPERYVHGVSSAIAAVLQGRIAPFPLLTHEVPLDSLDRAFELTRSRPDGFIKATVKIA